MGIDNGDDLFLTVSAAEVLEKQGHLEDALMIYKLLSDSSPWDETLSRKVASLKELAGGRRGPRKTAGGRRAPAGPEEDARGG